MEREKTGIRLRHLEHQTIANRERSPQICRKKIFQNNPNNSYDFPLQNNGLKDNQSLLTQMNKNKRIDNRQKEYEILRNNLKQKTFELEKKSLELQEKNLIIEGLKHKIQELKIQNEDYKLKVGEIQKNRKNQKLNLELNNKTQQNNLHPKFSNSFQTLLSKQTIKYSHQMLPRSNNTVINQNLVYPNHHQNNYSNRFIPNQFQGNYDQQNRDIVSPLMALNSDKIPSSTKFNKKHSFEKKYQIQDSRMYNFRDLNASQFEQIPQGFHY